MSVSTQRVVTESGWKQVSSTRERYEIDSSGRKYTTTTSSNTRVPGTTTRTAGQVRTIPSTGTYTTGTTRTVQPSNAVRTTSSTGLVNDEERNMIAESMAKIALLTMENNRLKMKYAEARDLLARHGINFQ